MMSTPRWSLISSFMRNFQHGHFLQSMKISMEKSSWAAAMFHNVNTSKMSLVDSLHNRIQSSNKNETLSVSLPSSLSISLVSHVTSINSHDKLRQSRDGLPWIGCWLHILRFRSKLHWVQFWFSLYEVLCHTHTIHFLVLSRSPTAFTLTPFLNFLLSFHFHTFSSLFI
jgi:hypothetical protein